MFQNIGTVEIIIIALVILVLFGGKKLPELARGLGTSGKEFKKAQKELKTALTEDEAKDQAKEAKDQAKKEEDPAKA